MSNIIPYFLLCLPIGNLITISILSMISKVKFNLKRKESQQFIKIDRTPLKEDLEFKELDMEGLDPYLIEPLKRFEATLNSIPHINKDNFYRNFSGSRVFLNKSFLKSIINNADAFYSKYDRYILLLTKKHSAFFHELLHSSSNVDVFHLGFRYFGDRLDKDVKGIIGTGINEGYTEVLNHRYFDKSFSYLELSIIALMVERIVGREAIESMYFNADLYGLLKSLRENLDLVQKDESIRDDIYNFIQDMDFLDEIGKYGFIEKEFENILSQAVLFTIRGAIKALERKNFTCANNMIMSINYTINYLPKKCKRAISSYLLELEKMIKSMKCEDTDIEPLSFRKRTSLKKLKNSLQIW